MKRRTRALAIGAATLLAGLAAIAAAPASASASGIEPNCSPRPGGPVVLYYDQGQSGANICLNGTFNNLNGYVFSNGGYGNGVPVANHAGSAQNLDTVWAVDIYADQGQTGARWEQPPCCDEGSGTYSLGPVTNDDDSIGWSAY
jgi:hypothetical protein